MDVAPRTRRRTPVLRRDQVVDDESLHPGSVVWLGEPALQPDELARYDHGHDVRGRAPAGPTGRPARG